MPDPSLQMLQDAAMRLASILDEIVFVGVPSWGFL